MQKEYETLVESRARLDFYKQKLATLAAQKGAIEERQRQYERDRSYALAGDKPLPPPLPQEDTLAGFEQAKASITSVMREEQNTFVAAKGRYRSAALDALIRTRDQRVQQLEAAMSAFIDAWSAAKAADMLVCELTSKTFTALTPNHVFQLPCVTTRQEPGSYPWYETGMNLLRKSVPSATASLRDDWMASLPGPFPFAIEEGEIA